MLMRSKLIANVQDTTNVGVVFSMTNETLSFRTECSIVNTIAGKHLDSYYQYNSCDIY